MKDRSTFYMEHTFPIRNAVQRPMESAEDCMFLCTTESYSETGFHRHISLMNLCKQSLMAILLKISLIQISLLLTIIKLRYPKRQAQRMIWKLFQSFVKHQIYICQEQIRPNEFDHKGKDGYQLLWKPSILRDPVYSAAQEANIC